ncbi:MAG: LiaI-LiaF-like domain-containing protein [Spirochaetaceae bacterium]
MSRIGPPRYPNKFLFSSVVFVLVGVILLLWNLGLIPRLESLWPLLLIIAGVALLYEGFVRRRRDAYVFIGMFALLLGLFFLLAETVLSPVAVSTIWPVFMTITGLSLVVYGVRRPWGSRMSFTVPGVAITVISFVFLLFSLDIVEGSFSRIVALYWPALLILVGLVLLGVHVTRRT